MVFKRFAGLFVVLWLLWAVYTCYSMRFDADQLVRRVAGLVKIGAVVFTAFAASEALGHHGTVS